MKDVCKSYIAMKFTYQVTNSRFRKLFAFHILGSCLAYTIVKGTMYPLFNILFIHETFLAFFGDTQTKIICKIYVTKNLTYQHTTSGFVKLLAFNLMGLFLGYRIVGGILLDLFTIVLLDESFPTIYRVTQMEIVCKCYAPGKLTYQLTILGLTKLLAFHLLVSCLVYKHGSYGKIMPTGSWCTNLSFCSSQNCRCFIFYHHI